MRQPRLTFKRKDESSLDYYVILIKFHPCCVQLFSLGLAYRKHLERRWLSTFQRRF
jgi:hypothetical protein